MPPLNRPAAKPTRSRTLPCPFILGCLALGLHFLTGVDALEAQENGGNDGISIYGPTFPPELEGLEETYVDYLHAWDSGNVSAVSKHFAEDVSILTRGGVEASSSGLEEILSLVIPYVRIRETRIHLLDLTDGWVSIGEMLGFNDLRTDADDSDPPRHGATLTVWERGHDLRWRVVFIAAPWIGRTEWTVLGEEGRVGGTLEAVPVPGSSSGALRP